MAKHPRAAEFFSFPPAAVVAIVAKVQALWLTHGQDKVRLEVHQHGHGTNADMNIWVIGDDEDGDTDSPPDNDDDDQPFDDACRCPGSPCCP